MTGIFGHDTEMTLNSIAALVNSDGDDGEQLGDLAALDAYVDAWAISGERRRDAAELRAVQQLRPRLRRLWEYDEDQVVELVNALLREADALPQLVRHDGWGYHLHATPAGRPLATRVAVDAAMAFVDLVRAGELGRLRICAYQNCGNVVVDLTRNRSKRFCDNGCGNRAAGAAYRARKAATPDSVVAGRLGSGDPAQ